MAVAEKIEQVIKKELNPEILEIINQSDKHAGHSGDNGSGESHFKLIIVSKAFVCKPRLSRHKVVKSLLSSYFSGNLHALSLSLYTPDEYGCK